MTEPTLQPYQSVMDAIPKNGVNEANLGLDHIIFKIHSIAAEGLSKASLYYAEVSVVGDDQITKWTTCVDKQGGKNPKWSKERTVMLNKTNVHRKLVHVLVKIYEKGIVLDHCVGEVRVPVGQRIDYRTERFPLLRSKFQAKKAKGAIKLACEIEAGQVTAKTDEVVIASSADDLAAANAQQAATAFSGMSADNLSYQPAVYSQVPPVPPSYSSYMPPGSFSSPCTYQQGGPGFWYPQPPPAYYQPMPQQPQRPNDLGVGAIAPLVMLGANMLGTSPPDVASSDLWSSFG